MLDHVQNDNHNATTSEETGMHQCYTLQPRIDRLKRTLASQNHEMQRLEGEMTRLWQQLTEHMLAGLDCTLVLQQLKWCASLSCISLMNEHDCLASFATRVDLAQAIF